MKRILLTVALVIAVTSILFGQTGWININRGESKNVFSFRRNRSIYLSDNLIGRCSAKLDRLLISPVSPKKGLALVLCTDEYTDNGGMVGYIVNKRAGLALARNIVPKDWVILKWVNWSPDEQYALVSAAGEVTMGDMAFIDLNTGRMQEIHFRDFTNNHQGRQHRLQDFDPDQVLWLSPTSFRLRLDVRCNSYEDTSCSDKVLSSHSVRVNLNPFAINYRIAR